MRVVIASVVALMLLLGLGMLIITRGQTAVREIQTNAARRQCMDNLQQIAAAMNAYAADHGTYPPATTRGEDGQPMHSWRVLILPYLGHDGLYARYDLSEPWDSPKNIELLYDMPDVYRSPAAVAIGGESHYMVITGPGTLFPGAAALGPDDVTDSVSKTLLVVEVARPSNADFNWMKPVDLDVSKMQFAIGSSDGVEIGGNHPGGATVATCDGRPHFVPATIDRGSLQALITPAGGEALPDDILD